MESNWLHLKPVNRYQQWYQSTCSDPWAKQLHRNTRVVLDKRNMQKETPPNTPHWAKQKKQLSPKGKQFLKQKVEEVVSYNSSKIQPSSKLIRESSGLSIKERWTEEKEKKFLISYGVGEAFVETNEGRITISNVLFTPEVTLNILSIDQLEEQGYMVNYVNNRCKIKYMFNEMPEAVEQEATIEGEDEDIIFESHNSFLDGYFRSLDLNEEYSLVKGLEDLKMNKEDVHDYVDNEYLSLNGTLYAMKVNTFPRFISFLDLIKIDKLVYGELPPVIGVIRIDLLGLYKFMDAMGGYMNVTFNDKWYQVAKFLGLAYEHHETVKEVYKEYIGIVKVYYEEAKRSRHGEPRDVAVNCRGTVGRERPQVSAKINVEVEEMPDETPRKRSKTKREDVNMEDIEQLNCLRDCLQALAEGHNEVISNEQKSIDELAQASKPGKDKVAKLDGKIMNGIGEMMRSQNKIIKIKKGSLSGNERVGIMTESEGDKGGSSVIDFSSPYYLHPLDSTKQPSVNKVLTDGNYNDWAREMTKFLSAKNKTDFVDRTLKKPETSSFEYKSWMRCDAMIKRRLTTAMEKGIRVSVKYANTSSEIRSDLKERFGKQSAPRDYELKKKITATRQEGNIVSTYYTRLKSLWDEPHLIFFPCCSYNKCTCELGKKITAHLEKQKLYEFLMRLDSDFNVIRTQILATKPVPTLGTAYHMVAEDERQRAISLENQAVPEPAEFKAFQRRDNNFRSLKEKYMAKQEKENKQNDECTFCRKRSQMRRVFQTSWLPRLVAREERRQGKAESNIWASYEELD
nr:Gag-pre-integrase domain, Gag-polypeptide of LTR copia-type [Tanacetum cinerariifolium]